MEVAVQHPWTHNEIDAAVTEFRYRHDRRWFGQDSFIGLHDLFKEPSYSTQIVVVTGANHQIDSTLWFRGKVADRSPVKVEFGTMIRTLSGVLRIVLKIWISTTLPDTPPTSIRIPDSKWLEKYEQRSGCKIAQAFPGVPCRQRILQPPGPQSTMSYRHRGNSTTRCRPYTALGRMRVTEKPHQRLIDSCLFGGANHHR